MSVATSDRSRTGTRPMQRHAWAAAQVDVSPAARWVLFALADHASPSGLAYPKVETLADEVGIRRQQVTGHLTRLETLGLVERVRLRRGGQLRGYLFRVLVPGSTPIELDELPRIAPADFAMPSAWREAVR